jgi:tetratricopeptide (TPR) repeat protein
MTLTLSLVGLSVGLVQITRERNRAVLLQRQAEERARWILLEVTRMDEETWQLSNIRLEPWQRQFIERVMAIVEKYAREFGDDGAARYETALILLRLGRVHYNLGQFEVADTHFRRALPLWEALAKAYPNNPDCLLHLAGCLMNVGNAEYLLRNPRDGGPYYRRALHLYEHITDRFPGYPLQQQLDLADCLAANGRVFERSGEPDQAEACYRRALIILLRLPAEPMLQHQYLYLTRMLSQSCQNLDSVLSTTDRPDEIDRVHGETLVQLEAMGPVSSEMRAIVLNKWAWSLLTRADVRSRNPRRAIELARLASELKSPDDAESWLMHGLGLEQTGDLQGAEGAFHRGIELGGDRPVNVLNAFAWQLVSEPSFRTVRPTWAVQMAERAVMLKSKRAAVWNTLGVARYRARDWPAAIQALEKSHSLSEDGHLGVNAFPMAMAYWQLGETTNARDWYENAVEWMEKKSIREGEVQRFRVEAEALLGITAQQSQREKPLP